PHRALDHEVLDLADRRRWVQPLRADIDAVHDRVAAEQPVGIVQIIETRIQCLVAAVRDESIRREQAGRADELVGIPPERRTRSRAARAENAFVEAVEALAFLRRLQTLL